MAVDEQRYEAKLAAATMYPMDTVLASALALTDAQVRQHIMTYYTNNTVLMALAAQMG